MVAIVARSGDLVGAESVRFLARPRFRRCRHRNDMRRTFFGDEASTTLRDPWRTSGRRFDLVHLQSALKTEMENVTLGCHLCT